MKIGSRNCARFVLFLALSALLAAIVGAKEKKGDFPHLTHKENDMSHQEIMRRLKDLGRVFAVAGAGAKMENIDPLIKELSGPYSMEYRWLQSGVVSRFLSLEKVNAISLPVTVNLLFIGFQGEGNKALNLTYENLSPWFEHIDHMLPQLHVPIAKEMGADPSIQLRTVSQIQYSYQFNVVELSSTVSGLLERYLKNNMRPIDPGPHMNDYMQEYQVNVDGVLQMLDRLLETLNLTTSYTLFILNPKVTAPDNMRYGYRQGFSDAEIAVLLQNAELSSAVNTQFSKQAKKEAIQNKFKNVMGGPAYDDVSNPTKKHSERGVHESAWKTTLGFKDMVEISEQWALSELDTLSKSPIEGITAERLAWKMLQGNTEQQDLVRMAFQDPGVSESCLVDTWIARRRYAFVDLSAGPFLWGPVVGGEGVRTEDTLPRVPTPQPSVTASLDDLSKLASEGADKHLPTNKKDLMAERDLLKHFLDRFCSEDGNNSLPLCGEIKPRFDAVERALASKSGELSDEHMDLISGSHEHEGEDLSIAEAGFLAKLGSVVSGFVRHVVTPATSNVQFHHSDRILFHVYFLIDHEAYDPFDVGYFDVESFKKELIRFQLPSQQFLFSIHRIRMKDDPSLAMAYTSAFRTAVVPKLSLDGQFEPSHRVYLDSLHLQSQLRVLSQRVHASQHSKGDPLTGKKKPTKTADAHDDEHEQIREVPIFIFSVDYSLPVLIDKYYQARPLVDMIIAVQSDHMRWDSGLFCNSATILWNLRDPMRATVSSVLTHLAGLLPPQVTYSQAHDRLGQEWMWSVGNNPFAGTSSGRYLSSLQQDAAHRSQVAYALDKSLRLINRGIDFLATSDAQTNKENYALLNDLPLNNLTSAFASVTSLWEMIAYAIDRLDFDEATYHLNELITSSIQFKKTSQEIKEKLGGYICQKIGARIVSTAQPSRRIGLAGPLLFAAVLSGAVAWFIFFRRRKSKPKMN